MASRKNEATWDERTHRWQIKVQVDGTRRRFVSSTKYGPSDRKGKIEAERKADTWLETQLIGESSTVGTMLDNYYESVKSRSGTEHCRQYEKWIRLCIRPVIGHKKIGRVTQGDLQDVIDIAYRDHNYARKSLCDLRGCLMNFLKYCRIHKATSLFVEDKLTVPSGATKPERTILDQDALKALMTDSITMYHRGRREDPYIWLYRFAVVTGLRPGERCGLRRSDVDGRIITIHRSINGANETTSGKNDNAERTMDVGEVGLWILDSQKAMLKDLGITSMWVFPDIRDGGPLTQHLSYDAWKRYCTAHGITSGTKPYELRHTWVSVNDEMPDYLKQQVAGHSKSMDTNGTYGHKKKGDMEKAAGYIDSAFSSFVPQKQVGTKVGTA